MNKNKADFKENEFSKKSRVRDGGMERDERRGGKGVV